MTTMKKEKKKKKKTTAKTPSGVSSPVGLVNRMILRASQGQSGECHLSMSPWRRAVTDEAGYPEAAETG